MLVVVHLMVPPMMITVIVATMIMSAVLFDDEFRRRHPGSQDACGRNRRPFDRQTAQRAAQLFERQPCIQQGAQHHVARCAVETVEIQNA